MCSHRSPLQRCPLDGKRRFRDKREATRALHGAVAARARSVGCGEVMDRRRETRAYACAVCKGWHLTSQEKRSREADLGLAS